MSGIEGASARRPWRTALGLVLVACGLWLPAAWAEDAADAKCSIAERLEALGTGIAVEETRQSPVAGVLELALDDGDYMYASEDCRYFFVGDLYELRDDGIVGITKALRDAKRQARMQGLLKDVNCNMD